MWKRLRCVIICAKFQNLVVTTQPCQKCLNFDQNPKILKNHFANKKYSIYSLSWISWCGCSTGQTWVSYSNFILGFDKLVKLKNELEIFQKVTLFVFNFLTINNNLFYQTICRMLNFLRFLKFNEAKKNQTALLNLKPFKKFFK